MPTPACTIRLAFTHDYGIRGSVGTPYELIAHVHCRAQPERLKSSGTTHVHFRQLSSSSKTSLETKDCRRCMPHAMPFRHFSIVFTSHSFTQAPFMHSRPASDPSCPRTHATCAHAHNHLRCHSPLHSPTNHTIYSHTWWTYSPVHHATSHMWIASDCIVKPHT